MASIHLLARTPGGSEMGQTLHPYVRRKRSPATQARLLCLVATSKIQVGCAYCDYRLHPAFVPILAIDRASLKIAISRSQLHCTDTRLTDRCGSCFDDTLADMRSGCSPREVVAAHGTVITRYSRQLTELLVILCTISPRTESLSADTMSVHVYRGIVGTELGSLGLNNNRRGSSSLLAFQNHDLVSEHASFRHAASTPPCMYPTAPGVIVIVKVS